MKTKIVLASLFLCTSLPALSEAEFISDPDILKQVKIEGLRAGGSACHVDQNGKPVDFKVHLNEIGSAFSVSFNKFQISGEDSEKSKDCILSLFVSYPQGTSLYVYESKVFGTSDLSGDDTATLETYLKLPDYPYPKRLISTIKADEDVWQSKDSNFEGNQIAPCGGNFYKIQYSMNLKLNGSKDSFVAVSDSLGVIDPDKVKFKLKKCN